MQTMDNTTAASDRQEIESLFSEFSRCVDHGDVAGLSGLFVPDGVLCVGGLEIKGQTEIGSDLGRRFESPGRKTRHLWSNLRIVSMDTQTAETAAVQMTFEQAGKEKPTQLRISDLTDSLRRDSEGKWRFVKRTIERQMSLSFAE